MSATQKVWSRFSKVKDGKELKMRIETFPEEKIEEFFQFWFKFMVPDEPFQKASKVVQRPEAVEEYKNIMRMMFKEPQNHVDACYLEDAGEDRVVGMSVMALEKRDNDNNDFEIVKSMVKTEEVGAMFNLLSLVDDQYNVFEKYNTDVCYMGRGLAVHSDYRGLGIAGELLRVRSTVCKEHKVSMTCAWMTSIGTQKAAAMLGWETLLEVRYKDLEARAGVQFDDQPATGKLMAIKI